eukprot:TRINITY_DN14974_c0_g1_i1.p1 TRINITY_DN14974_c0_g1~~TRINITY_DN14974_c0_g1_i1.p1  ORF type:complete len:1193 (+),score=262.83 TRINITY_DN14974_c0_g1_i1:321-3581(+)
MEYEVAGSETWYDRDNDKICQISKMPPEILPPLRQDFIGERFDAGDSIFQGGDWDARLVLILGGSVEKLVGNGQCTTRILTRGDCEGLTEFLGCGSQQRTCALRAGKDGAHVRWMPREAVQELLKQEIPAPVIETEEDSGSEIPDEDEPQEPEMVSKWPKEVDYFEELLLEQIDALPHDASRELLKWDLGGGEILEFMKIPGQTLFNIDDSLGLKTAGPLPEGIEERYFFDNQIVFKKGIPGDCLVMILRGEVRAEVPEDCGGTCVPALEWLDALKKEQKGKKLGSWIGDGRKEVVVEEEEEVEDIPENESELEFFPKEEVYDPGKERIYISTLVRTDKMKSAKKHLNAAVDNGTLPPQEGNTDWSWEVRDPAALVALDVLERRKYLTPLGEQKAEMVREFQNPPPEEPPPEPRAILRSGSLIGSLALLGVPVVFSGDVRAKGPMLCVILHRHILLEALQDLPEYGLFASRGIKMKETIEILSTPLRPHGDEGLPSSTGAPSTGPPPAEEKSASDPGAGSLTAWKSEDSPYFERPGGDSMWLLLLNAVRKCTLLWDIIVGAPPRLLEDFIRLFQPRWLLPCDIVVQDEEPDCNFLFVVIHGSLVVTLDGSEIDRIGQGDIQGEAQLLGLNDWTRTIHVDPKHQGEAMIQILQRDRLLQVLAGHPVPRQKLQEVEEELKAAKNVDWRVLKNIPVFRNVNYSPFLARVFKDADILMYSPGDHIAVAGKPGSSLIVILAGVCRSEQSQTLFCVYLRPMDWCFQNNYLGNDKYRDHDLVVTSHCIVLTLHRHTLLNAIIAHPPARSAIVENETWRGLGPQLHTIPVFEGVPSAIIARLIEESVPRYYKENSPVLAKEESVEDDNLLLILRGEVQVQIMGYPTRKLGPGDTLGLLRYLDLPYPPSPAEYIAVTAVDAMCIPRKPMFDSLEDPRFDEAVHHFKTAVKVLGGGEVVDAFGFPMGGGGVFMPDCVEQSEIFAACSKPFVNQIGTLVEDVAFFPGQEIFKQGGAGEVMYFIQAGRVRTKMIGLKKDEFVDGGGVIGNMAVLGQVAGHPHTAIAETHVWARSLNKTLLYRALKSFPADEHRIQGAK